MDLYSQKSRSIPQKVLIHLLELILIGISYWILFQNGGNWCAENLHITNAAGASERRLIIFACHIILFLRFGFMMIFLLKRRIPWEESISVPMAFGLYYIGFSLFVLPTSAPLEGLDFVAMLLFVIGSVLNTGGEILRNQWKKRPENKGKIYTEGFFKYSRHINYFGDLLWVIAYAMLSKNVFAFSIVIFLFCFFAFYNAPKLDTYLEEKYGEAYEEYAKNTKMLIPFIF